MSPKTCEDDHNGLSEVRPDGSQLIAERRSAPALQLGEPYPGDHELTKILGMSLRVPDHGRLAPWRLVVVEQACRPVLAAALTARRLQIEPDAPAAKVAKERDRWLGSPLIVVVVATLDLQSRIPAIEQALSAGCVAHNLLLATFAAGYKAQWLTGWAAYDAGAAALFGVEAPESIVGFIHIGSADLSEIPDRTRPSAAEKTRRLTAPGQTEPWEAQ